MVVRVAGIGLDGMEWSLVQSMMREGELPALAALRQCGTTALLHHVDFRAGLSWEHFVTGRSAAGNGRFSAISFDPETYEVRQVGARPVPPFFATSPPLQTIAFDLPYMSLMPDVDGIRVTGWGGHDPAYPRAARPAGVLRELDDVIGIHRALHDQYETVWYRHQLLETIADSLIVGALRRAEASAHLMRRFPNWDLFLTVMSEAHSAGEELWYGISSSHPTSSTASAPFARRRLREVYRAIDTAVARILGALPQDVVTIVFSMGGMHENEADVTSMALLPELLYRVECGDERLRGPDPYRWRRAGCPLVTPAPDKGWSESVRKFFVAPPEPAGQRPRVNRRTIRPFLDRTRAVRAALRPTAAVPASPPPLEQLGILGDPMERETTRTPEEIGVPTHIPGWQPTMWYRPWWPSMRFFALPSFYDGRVRVNLRGRESSGIVARDDYKVALDRVEHVLAECRSARTGRPAVTEVVRLRAEDPMGPGGPAEDLAVHWTEPCDAIEHPTAGVVGPLPFRRSGGHTPNGFAMVAGPGIGAGELGRRDALDVAPTILDLLGRWPRDGIEGTPMLDGNR